MKPLVMHVIAARPNFPKAAPVIEALNSQSVSQQVVHTGQHYDDSLSNSFIRQLNMPDPVVNLAVGSGSQAGQTAAVMLGMEKVFASTRPSLLVVYGDVNSTLAAALVASKLGIQIAHVEAGLRSGDRSMPEEINRILTDKLSDILFTTSADAVGHLADEGVDLQRIHFVGNPMIDSLFKCRPLIDTAGIVNRLGLTGKYVLTTLHRPGNVDSDERAATLVNALHSVAEEMQVVLPLHPRGRSNFDRMGLLDHPNMKVIHPLGYLDFVSLMQGSEAVLTDSGGVQEESTMLGVPCFTLRPNTERPVTITSGTNQLVEPEFLHGTLRRVLTMERGRWSTPPLWDGNAGPRIARVIAASV
ncbi:UDP-N-acetylglucosamine 2-epimerase (non-hydrolyzing) [Actinoplanes sp. NPDC051475]|uniref:non-hydrolyzing UDP-N-acetylglucosamine 2-epimerase n=1 Tax=Actinoplanes sp. NPDC051475 TaxID=3157225 RepID=UPI00344B192F